MSGASGRLALVELAHLSHTGLVRPHNEDRSLARPPVLAVADGMGGAKAGEVAADVAVREVGELRPPVSSGDVRAAIDRANRSIREMAREDPDKSGMGTTLTAALLADGRLKVVHVGDSRAYLWRDGELRQLTEDHSVVAELVRRGSLSPEDAEHHPHRNVITRALGAEPEVVADTVTESPREGDVILLCSDGLSSYVPAADIAEALAGSETLELAARRLVERANAAGGTDNVTVVLGRLGREDEAPEAREGREEDLGDTMEAPIPGRAAGADAARARETRVLGGVRGHAGTERPGAPPPSRTPRVLERVHRPRRSRRRLALVGVLAALLAVVGAVTWVASRTYSLETSPEGTVRVAHGLPFSIGGLSLSRPWQDIEVAAEAVRAGDPEALERSARGKGEAVELAARLVWRHGLPEVPAPRAPLGAGPAPSPSGGGPVDAGPSLAPG